MPARAPEISLEQKYLTTTTSFDPSYNTLDQHRDLKKLTGPNTTSRRGVYGEIFTRISTFITSGDESAQRATSDES